jgi:hypothetical protein
MELCMVAPKITSLLPVNTNCSPHSVATESHSPLPQDPEPSKNAAEPHCGQILSLHARVIVITIVDHGEDAGCNTIEDIDELHASLGCQQRFKPSVETPLGYCYSARGSTYTQTDCCLPPLIIQLKRMLEAALKVANNIAMVDLATGAIAWAIKTYVIDKQSLQISQMAYEANNRSSSRTIIAVNRGGIGR